jgi:PEGA domain-containing protein
VSLSLKSAHQWRISTRTRGEVLAASAGSEDCQFLVLGVPDGHTSQEIEAWLADLLGVAAESTLKDSLPRPIPPLLHHALTALLFSHREVWNASPPGSIFSLAFVQSGDDVGFGWVGLGHPRVWIDDQPAEAQWVRVRDHGGREAYALAVKAGASVRVSLDWRPSSAPPDGVGVQVEAMRGAGGPPQHQEPEAAPFTIADMVDPLAGSQPAATESRAAAVPVPIVAASPAPSGVSPAPAPRPEIPELIPPSPESPDLTARALRSQAAETQALRSDAADRAPAPEIFEGATLAPPVRPRPRMRPAWPSEQELKRTRRRSGAPWIWIGAALVVAAALWGAGLYPGARRAGSNPVLALIGLGGARFHVSVDSRPQGAWIAADGKDLSLRTPATIELPAGEHQIALSFPDLGSATFSLRGARGDRQSLSTPLWGTLAVHETDANVPIAVELDGTQVGYAPVTVDSLAPGAHELRFSGPGLTPWGQALRVKVGETAEVIARPMTEPANGVLEVRATFTDGNGTNPLEGASVWVDGERRGLTPLVLELPRGPHSARVEYRGESAPIEVIDLPGGNQRFATFELGLNVDTPTLQAGPLPALLPVGRPTVVSSSLDNVTTNDVREMWLNVREPEGTWRRYQMVMLKAPDGVVGVAVFPVALFDARGAARYYMSATTQTGDDYFTEILTAHTTPRSRPAGE